MNKAKFFYEFSKLHGQQLQNYYFRFFNVGKILKQLNFKLNIYRNYKKKFYILTIAVSNYKTTKFCYSFIENRLLNHFIPTITTNCRKLNIVECFLLFLFLKKKTSD